MILFQIYLFFFVLISPNLGEPIQVKFTEEMQKLGIDELILDPYF